MYWIKIQKENGDNPRLFNISLDYPNWKNNRLIYLEELLNFLEISQKINKVYDDLSKYNVKNMELSPHYIQITSNTFQSLQNYLKEKTKYEQCKLNDEIELLNILVSLYRKDPKNWEL